MSSGPAVIVNKGGFFSNLVKGLFGTIMVIVICGTALGLYGMWIANNYIGNVAQQVLTVLPAWQEAMPPAIADALNDRRDLTYRDSLDITARLVQASTDHRSGTVVVEVVNNGQEIVSLLTLRVILEDESDTPLCELPVLAVTPLQIDCDWRGPLLPGETRRIPRRVWDVVGKTNLSVEMTELRVCNEPGDGSRPEELALPILPLPAEPPASAAPAGTARPGPTLTAGQESVEKPDDDLLR